MKQIAELNARLPLQARLTDPRVRGKDFEEKVDLAKKKCRQAYAGKVCSFGGNCKFKHPSAEELVEVEARSKTTPTSPQQRKPDPPLQRRDAHELDQRKAFPQTDHQYQQGTVAPPLAGHQYQQGVGAPTPGQWAGQGGWQGLAPPMYYPVCSGHASPLQHPGWQLQAPPMQQQHVCQGHAPPMQQLPSWPPHMQHQSGYTCQAASPCHLHPGMGCSMLSQRLSPYTQVQAPLLPQHDGPWMDMYRTPFSRAGVQRLPIGQFWLPHCV